MGTDSFTDKKVMVSEFNEASYQIARLNVLWQQCNFLASSGNLSEWKWKLDRIWIELSADAKSKNEKYYYGGIKLINEVIGKSKTEQSLYNSLQQKEIFLRSLQEDVGKGGKKKQQFEEW